jgi:hypothetical protein
MKRFCSLRRASLSLALLGILCIFVTPFAARAEPFQARGSYVDTNVEPNTTKGKVVGEAAPGGEFVGHYWHRKSFDGPTTADGRATLDFGNGDTLTIDYVFVYDSATGLFLGNYVVRRGTGTFKQATGGGDIAVTVPVDGQGLIWLDGELFLN